MFTFVGCWCDAHYFMWLIEGSLKSIKSPVHHKVLWANILQLIILGLKRIKSIRKSTMLPKGRWTEGWPNGRLGRATEQGFQVLISETRLEIFSTVVDVGPRSLGIGKHKVRRKKMWTWEWSFKTLLCFFLVEKNP